jgi:predicted flavoprotein YhiN
MKSKTKISNFYCDVLVIGSGSASLRTAIEAYDAGAHVLIISRSKKGDPVRIFGVTINLTNEQWQFILFSQVPIWAYIAKHSYLVQV